MAGDDQEGRGDPHHHLGHQVDVDVLGDVARLLLPAQPAGQELADGGQGCLLYTSRCV
ncbi:hypothetical protein [Streptomyces fragilis]|uniref:hypothetical protein n=1 Tax=Streptomyces fragilis TaxID=67301 RepID=UPI0024DE374F|nr:hypothetical protein [Streptomyces fragilis]